MATSTFFDMKKQTLAANVEELSKMQFTDFVSHFPLGIFPDPYRGHVCLLLLLFLGIFKLVPGAISAVHSQKQETFCVCTAVGKVFSCVKRHWLPAADVPLARLAQQYSRSYGDAPLDILDTLNCSHMPLSTGPP